MISLKGHHHHKDIILQWIRRHVAYALSSCNLEELMQKRGYTIDHSTLHRWIVRYASYIKKACRESKKKVGLMQCQFDLEAPVQKANNRLQASRHLCA